MTGFLKHVRILFSVSLIITACNEDSPAPEEVSTPKRIGVWEVRGDTMIVWQENSGTPLHIKFVYVPPQEYNSDIPKVRFVLVDSTFTSEDQNPLDILNIEYLLLVPPSFGLISAKFKSKGFDSTPASFIYESVHEVYCENNSSVNQLSFKSYIGKNSARKYEFDTVGIGEAIRHIACK